MNVSGIIFGMNLLNSTISNITNTTNITTITNINDENQNRKIGIFGLILLICMCGALLIILCIILSICCNGCFQGCSDCCQGCCRRNSSRTLTRRHRNYFEESLENGGFVDPDDDSNFTKTQNPQKNNSFITMTEMINLKYKDETCSICLEPFIESRMRIIETECGHLYHINCISNDIITTCPLCREPFKYKHYFDVQSHV